MIRCDGPYGDLSFNYRRYGVLVLAGGGIGITPLLSILKDIYEISEEGPSKKKPKHCIKTVSLVWVMTHTSEASLFLNLLNDFYEGSLVDSELPELKLSIHITRDNTEIHGHQVKFTRPDFNSIMEQCVDDTDDVTSCLVYGCGPAKMINNLWDASLEKNSKKMRVDFYHESFEF